MKFSQKRIDVNIGLIDVDLEIDDYVQVGWSHMVQLLASTYLECVNDSTQLIKKEKTWVSPLSDHRQKTLENLLVPIALNTHESMQVIRVVLEIFLTPLRI